MTTEKPLESLSVEMDFRIRVAELFGTVFYIGKIPFAPGTWGSTAALIAWYILKPYWIDPLFLLITGVFFFLGIVITHILVEFWKEKDPKSIVIDEWVGMWIALYLVPHNIGWAIISFFFFRLFDIFKPGPIKVMDEMDGAIGVMLDDVVAGILACLVTQSLLYFNL